MRHSMIPKFGRLGQKMAHSFRKCAIRINAHRYAPPKIYIGDLQCMQTACGLIFCLPNYSIIVMTDRLACSNQCIHDDGWQCNAHTPFIVFMNTPLPKKVVARAAYDYFWRCHRNSGQLSIMIHQMVISNEDTAFIWSFLNCWPQHHAMKWKP